MLPGNDLAWTHLREEPAGILFGGAWQNDEWAHSLSKAERAVSSLLLKGQRGRELTHMDSFQLSGTIFWFIQVVGVI